MKQEGYILLITVLVVGAIMSAIASSLLLLGLGSGRSSYALGQSEQAKGYANACVEEAIERLSRDNTYVAGDSITFDDGSCTINAITGTGDTNRVIQVTGVVVNNAEDTTSSETDDVTRKLEVSIADLGPPVDITSWLEVGNF